MKRKLIHELNPYYKIPFDELTLEEIEETTFLKSVEELFHFHKNARYSIKEVALKDIKPLTRYVYDFRVEKAKKILEKYQEKSVPLYNPIRLNYKNEFSQIVAPPILELHNDTLVLCDGTHRIYTALTLNFEKVHCLVIENVNIPLPGDINEWDNVNMLDSEVPVSENFINYRPEHLTGYTWIFNGEKVWIEKGMTT